MAPHGRRGKSAMTELRLAAVPRASRRSDCTRAQPGLESLSSRHHKLERKRTAAEGSRKEHSRREVEWNRLRPEDFGARALWRANGMSPIVDRRSSVNRSSCGRRTSLVPRGLRKNSHSGATYIYSFTRCVLASRVPDSIPLKRPLSQDFIEDGGSGNLGQRNSIVLRMERH